MARRIGVEIVGDSTLLERAFLRSTKSARRFNAEISGVSRGVTRSFAGATAAILGGAGLVHAIRSSIQATSDLGEQVSKTEVVFGQSGDAVVQWSKTLANSFGLSQREALTLSSTFGAIFRPLGFATDEAAKQSEQLTELGADLASFYNTDVTSALDALRAGVVGQARPLLKYGIIVKAARVQTEALRETGKRTASQLTEQEKATARLTLIYKDSNLAQGDFARTSGHLAQQTKIAQANIENLREAVGEALVPAVTEVVSSFNEWLQTGDNQKQLVKDLKSAADALVHIFDDLKGAIEGINSVTGSGRNSLKLFLAVLVAYKGLKVAASLKSVADSIGLIGTNARRARGELKGLPGGVGGPAGPAAPAAESTAAKFARNLGKAGAIIGAGFVVAKGLQKLIGQAPLLISPQSLRLGVRSAAVPSIFQPPGRPGDVRPPAGILGPTGPGQRRPGIATTAPPPPPVDPKFQRAANEALRQMRVDEAAFAVEKTALTKSLSDDIAANEKLNALLLRRIKGDHATLDIRRQQLQVQLTINDLLQQQADARKAAAEAARKAALDARNARQFRFLGLGPGGEELAPKVKGLKRELGSVEGLVAGTFLDTKKTRSMISRIRQLLSGALGALSAEVRTKIRQMLDDLENQVKNKSVDQTKFHKVAPGILGALGLNEKQRKVLSRILPQLGPGGTLPTPGAAFAGAGAQPIIIQIDGKTVAKVTAKHNEDALGHRKKGRAHSRRGTR